MTIKELKQIISNGGATLNSSGAEHCDVTIRCYYLSQAIGEALDDLAGEYADEIDNYAKEE